MRWKLEGSTGETQPVSGSLDFLVIPDDGRIFAIYREGLALRYDGREIGTYYVGHSIYVVDEATYQEFVSIDRYSLNFDWITRLGESEVVYQGTCTR